MGPGPGFKVRRDSRAAAAAAALPVASAVQAHSGTPAALALVPSERRLGGAAAAVRVLSDQTEPLGEAGTVETGRRQASLVHPSRMRVVVVVAARPLRDQAVRAAAVRAPTRLGWQGRADLAAVVAGRERLLAQAAVVSSLFAP